MVTLKKKKKILIAAATLLVLLTTGCSSKKQTSDNTSTVKAATKAKQKWVLSDTTADLKSKYSISQTEFVSNGQDIINILKDLCDKEGITYTTNYKYSKGHWLSFDTGNIKLKSEKGHSYTISYTGDIITASNTSNAFNNVEIDVSQKDTGKPFDADSCKFLKKIIVKLTDNNDYNFKSFNDAVKQVDKDCTKKVLSDRLKTNSKSFETVRIVKYSENKDTLEYKFVTGKMNLK
ncbi:hypothetical protein [Clostridium felsineum]|uniref:hypothetical protein n=1 Tax=Clostridium felsineum TaxID=36839 RepID=UPI001FA910A0|nr:hypothetical protein [Clostridium felsineum]